MVSGYKLLLHDVSSLCSLQLNLEPSTVFLLLTVIPTKPEFCLNHTITFYIAFGSYKVHGQLRNGRALNQSSVFPLQFNSTTAN